MCTTGSGCPRSARSWCPSAMSKMRTVRSFAAVIEKALELSKAKQAEIIPFCLGSWSGDPVEDGGAIYTSFKRLELAEYPGALPLHSKSSKKLTVQELLRTLFDRQVVYANPYDVDSLADVVFKKLDASELANTRRLAARDFMENSYKGEANNILAAAIGDEQSDHAKKIRDLSSAFKQLMGGEPDAQIAGAEAILKFIESYPNTEGRQLNILAYSDEFKAALCKLVDMLRDTNPGLVKAAARVIAASVLGSWAICGAVVELQVRRGGGGW